MAAEIIDRLEQQVATVVLGKPEVIRQAVVCLLAKGHLLIEDVPGVGKTTLVQRVMASLADHRIAGFTTEEIRGPQGREGFRLVTFDGREAVMAHVDFPKTHRVGKYGVDVEAIEKLIDADPHDEYTRYLLGKCLLHQGNRLEALPAFEHFLEKEPAFARFRLRRLIRGGEHRKSILDSWNE